MLKENNADTVVLKEIDSSPESLFLFLKDNNLDGIYKNIMYYPTLRGNESAIAILAKYNVNIKESELHSSFTHFAGNTTKEKSDRPMAESVFDIGNGKSLYIFSNWRV